MRIRSLAERTRYAIFSCLEKSNQTANPTAYGNGDWGDEDSTDEVDEPWMLEAARVYEKSLMLLAEQDPEPEGMEEFSCL